MSRGIRTSARRRAGLAVLLLCGACSEPGGTAALLGDAATADAGTSDAGPDAAVSVEGLCDAYCGAVATACGAGEADCAGDCKARLPTLRGTCPATFRSYFECLLDEEAWACVSPGVVRVLGCDTWAEPWQACAR